MDAQLLPVFSSIFLGVLKMFKMRVTKANTKRLPPGPKKLPLIGNMHQVGEFSPESLQRFSNEFGSIISLQLGFVPIIVVSSANLAREITKNHDRVFSSRPAFYVERKYTYEYQDVSFAPYGEYWREAKKILTLGLLSPKRVQSFGTIRSEEVTRLVDAIANSAMPINLSKLAFAYGNNLICRAAFSKAYGGGKYDGSNKYFNVVRETMKIATDINIANFFPWMFWINKFNGIDKRINNNFKLMDELYDKIIEDHVDPARVDLEYNDIVDALLHTHRAPNQTIAFTKDQIKGFFQDIFMAGTEAVYAGIIWTMSELMRNPEAMRRAQAEVRKIIKGKSKVEEKDLPELEYLKLVLKESLRLHPLSPLLIPRLTIENSVISGYEIPANTIVVFNVKAISLDPSIWKDPNEFKPERFSDSIIDVKGQEFESLPFGAARRICPGAAYGLVAIELALANLLCRFDWKLPDGITKEDIDMEAVPGIVVQKKIHLCLVATPVNV